MINDTLNLLNGNRIKILRLSLVQEEFELAVLLSVRIENIDLHMRFNNVSNFSLTDISIPMEIQGFEIIDNTSRGWEQDSRYTIRDYEEGSIYFICESFELIQP